MKKSRFTDGKTMAVLKEAEARVAVPELCRPRARSPRANREPPAPWGGFQRLGASVRGALKLKCRCVPNICMCQPECLQFR